MDRTAPEGIYYLLEPTSVTTSDGIVGLSRGTELRKVEEGVYLAEGHRVELASTQVTNDTYVAQQLRRNEAAQQARIRETLSATDDPGSSGSSNTAASAPVNRSPNPPSPSPTRSAGGGRSSLQGSTLQRSGKLGSKH
jgi:hypothetical protein